MHQAGASPRTILAALLAALLLAPYGAAGSPCADRAELPPDTPPRVRQLIDKLYSPDRPTQLEGARALGAMGEEAALAAPYLVTLLWGKSDINRAAHEALVRIGKPSVESVVTFLQVAENRYIFSHLLAIIDELRDERGTEALAMRMFRTGDRRALQILARIGLPAVDRLIGMLKSPNHLARIAAAQCLVISLSPRTVEALSAAAADQDPEVRAAVLETLSYIVDQTDAAVCPPVETVVAASKDPDGAVRRGAFAILAALTATDRGDFVQPLLEAFRDNDRGVQLTALRAISELAQQGKMKGQGDILDRQALPALTEALRDPDPAVRSRAADVTALLEQRGLTGALAALLKDESGQVRARAIYALGSLKVNEALPAVKQALQDDDSLVRKAAIEVIAEADGKDAEETLKPLLEDPEEYVAQAARSALEKLGAKLPPPKPEPTGKRRAQPPRREVMPTVSTPPAEAIGPPPLPPLPHRPQPPAPGPPRPPSPPPPAPAASPEQQAFFNMLRSNKEREKAVQAAAKMPDRGLAWLTDALKSADPAVRSGAAYAVGRNKLGAAAGPLLRLLDDPSRGVPDEAGRAFTALKGEPGAVASLKEAIKDARTRERAVLMLGQMGDGSAAEVLASLLGDADWRLRRLATQSLAELKATAALQKALQDRYWYVRVCAAECLGRVGSLEAVPGLIAALSDEHWYVRSSAHASLAKLTGQQLPPDPTQWQAWWGREGKKAAGLAK